MLYRFGDCQLDGARFELRRGDRLEPLEPQVFALLLYLIQHRDRVVTRTELNQAVWYGRFVTDSALNSCIKAARHAIGDDGKSQSRIRTLQRTGYRFVGPVSEQPDAIAAASERGTAPASSDGGVPSTRRRQSSFFAALLAVLGIVGALWYRSGQEVAPPLPESGTYAEAEVKSIAVLPFTDLSPEQDQQYFSEGLSEELLNVLARSRRLRVIARTSSFSFKDENVDIATVARRLNVTHVLEGSVRKSGNEVRVTAQLVDGATSSHLWSKTYDRKLDDIFKVQSDIAGSVADALEVVLGDDIRPGASGNTQAYEGYLRARFFFQRRAPGDMDRAKQNYSQALEIDPGFARAWAGLAGVYWIQTSEGALERDTGLRKLRDAAERALALNPDLAEAHLRLANYLTSVGDRKAAVDHQRRAAALEPNNPLGLGFRAGTAARNGRWEEAIELQRRAVAADPLSVATQENLSAYLFLAGRLSEAKTESAKLAELEPTRPNEIAALVLISNRRFDEALRLVRAWPESSARAQCLAFVYHGLGRKADADAALEQLIASYGASEPFRIAEIHAYRGETEEAFQWLQTITRLTPERRRRPFLMRASPFLEPLHDDARWDEWIASTQ